MTLRAALFDFSGTLFRLQPDDTWFADVEVDGRAAEGALQAEIVRRLTKPTGQSVEMSAEQHETWRRPAGPPTPTLVQCWQPCAARESKPQ